MITLDQVVATLPELTFYRGRVAMFQILKALGIGPGDLVATQAFTCLAVPEGILATGAKPCYIDTAVDQVNLCLQDLKLKWTPKIKAVIVQHTFGIPANIIPIKEFCDMQGVPLIEDCCHTFASELSDQLVGTFGVGAFYSFEWGKPIIAGVGGSAILNDPVLRSKVKDAYDQCGQPSKMRQLKVQAQYAVFNLLYRPSTYWTMKSLFHKLSKIGAAEGNYNPSGEVSSDFSTQMAQPLVKRVSVASRFAKSMIEHSNEISAKYEMELNPKLRRVCSPEGSKTVYARFPLLVDDKQAVIRAAELAKVEIADWYKTPIHPLRDQEFASVHYELGSCPRAENLSKHLISLPVNQKVSQQDIRRIVLFLNGL